VTPGGEVVFVSRMVDDSIRLRERVRWYTSMLGRKQSLRELLAKLRQAGVHNVRSTEFCQGKTTRWGVAWSFTADGMAGDGHSIAPADKVFSRKGKGSSSSKAGGGSSGARIS
jgi:hypothetical protein